MKTELIERNTEALAQAGQAANKKAALRAFVEFRSRKAENTLRRYDADLALFAEFLQEGGSDITNENVRVLAVSPEAWRGITWGLVDEFVRWQLKQGYAISTINFRLSTIRVFAKLAFKAGVLSNEEYTLIQQARRPQRQREAPQGWHGYQDRREKVRACLFGC
jgi:site-specific recombinase XerD